MYSYKYLRPRQLKTLIDVAMLSLTIVWILGALNFVLADPPELPPIPSDLTTPVQQRIAFNGATGVSLSINHVVVL